MAKAYEGIPEMDASPRPTEDEGVQGGSDEQIRDIGEDEDDLDDAEEVDDEEDEEDGV